MNSLEKRYIIRIKRKNPEVRLAAIIACLLVICLPIHTMAVGGFGLLLLLGVPLMILCIPALQIRVRRTSWDKATIFLGLFFAYNILAYAWTPVFSTYSLYNYIKNVAIVVCLYCLNLKQKEKKLLLAGAVVAPLMICWFVLTDRNIGYTDDRVTLAVLGIEQDPNYLGYLFLVPMAVAAFQFFNNKSLLIKILCVLLAMLVLFCTLMTGSRGALLGQIAIVVTCLTKRFREPWKKALFVASMVVLVMVVYRFILQMLPDYLAVRFSVQDVIETRGTGRADIWMDVFRAIAKKPYMLIFGFGNSSSQVIIGWATHNFILQLLLELGIVGTVLFLRFLWIWIKRLEKCDLLCLSIVIGCMAMAMTLSVNTVYYFWVVFTLGIVCSKAKPWNVGDDIE